MANIRSFSIFTLATLSSCITLQERRDIAFPESSMISPRTAFDVGQYASLGDSYTSGPSASDKYDDSRCRRYNQAVGPQISEDPRILGPKPIGFDFIACSGSKLQSIYQDWPEAPEGKSKLSQSKQLDNPDMVTMSIDGNDVRFVEVLDRV